MKKIKDKQIPKRATVFTLLFLISCLLVISCKKAIREPIIDEEGSKAIPTEGLKEAPAEYDADINDSKEAVSTQLPIINPEGKTLLERFNPPKGYKRQDASLNELTGFIRNLPLKEADSPVLLYNGEKKAYQDGHVAVFDIDVGDRDLQQCADSVMRIYAEYFWSIEAYDKIAFHLTNGFLMEYSKWRDGNRLVVDGNNTSWSKKADYDDSYESFRKYLNMVYTYAGTISLSKECRPISIEDILPGDIFINAGSPGHCVLVVDLAINDDGSKCFLLAQGYMPAQDFHILKNPLHPEDPWYYTNEIQYPLQTPQWSFNEGSLMRWQGFEASNTL